MELRRYYTILRRRWLFIVLTIVAGVAGGYLVTPRATLYESTTTVYVGTRVFGGPNGSIDSALSSDRQAGLLNIMQTFAIMIPSGPIARDALQRTGVSRPPGQVVAETSVRTKAPQLLAISVTDPDPVTAQRLADGVAQAFTQKAQQLEPTPAVGTLPILPAYQFEPASFPSAPLSTSLEKNMILGGAFGLLVSCALAFVLEYVDLTIRAPEDAERRLGLPVLGVVPMLGSGGLTPSPKLLHAVRLGAVRESTVHDTLSGA